MDNDIFDFTPEIQQLLTDYYNLCMITNRKFIDVLRLTEDNFISEDKKYFLSLIEDNWYDKKFSEYREAISDIGNFYRMIFRRKDYYFFRDSAIKIIPVDKVPVEDWSLKFPNVKFEIISAIKINDSEIRNQKTFDLKELTTNNPLASIGSDFKYMFGDHINSMVQSLFSEHSNMLIEQLIIKEKLNTF